MALDNDVVQTDRHHQISVRVRTASTTLPEGPGSQCLCVQHHHDNWEWYLTSEIRIICLTRRCVSYSECDAFSRSFSEEMDGGVLVRFPSDIFKLMVSRGLFASQSTKLPTALWAVWTSSDASPLLLIARPRHFYNAGDLSPDTMVLLERRVLHVNVQNGLFRPEYLTDIVRAVAPGIVPGKGHYDVYLPTYVVYLIA